MKNIILISSILTIFLYSCEDFIEPNIGKKVVVLNSPQNMDTLSNTVSFWWEEVPYAINYNIQIVKNSFETPTQLILDSNVTDNIFSIQLSEGLFEWRLRAQNNFYSTKYVSRFFYVQKGSDLTNETISLSSPNNNYNSNNQNQRFKWNTLLNANAYDIEIIDNFEDIFAYETTSDDTITIFLNEGIYTWRVKAKNETTETAYYTKRTVLIDITPPTKPIQVNPINNLVDTSTTVSFSWNSGTSLSEITDTLFIYSDSLITIYEILYTNNTSLHYDFTALGTYFWRVQSGDRAGNTSQYSNTRKITIN